MPCCPTPRSGPSTTGRGCWPRARSAAAASAGSRAAGAGSPAAAGSGSRTSVLATCSGTCSAAAGSPRRRPGAARRRERGHPGVSGRQCRATIPPAAARAPPPVTPATAPGPSPAPCPRPARPATAGRARSPATRACSALQPLPDLPGPRLGDRRPLPDLQRPGRRGPARELRVGSRSASTTAPVRLKGQGEETRPGRRPRRRPDRQGPGHPAPAVRARNQDLTITVPVTFAEDALGTEAQGADPGRPGDPQGAGQRHPEQPHLPGSRRPGRARRQP